MPKNTDSPSKFGRIFLVLFCLFIGYLAGVNQKNIAAVTAHIPKVPLVNDAVKRVKVFSSKVDIQFPQFPSKQSSDVQSVVTVKEGQIKLCSFNIRILSDKSRSERELESIAKIVSLYDIIAVQEVRDTQVLKRLVTKLADMGFPFEFDASPKVGRGVKEIYAFMWRKDKVQQLKRGKLYEDYKDEFIREPYYATFKAGDFDFTLLTIHLFFGQDEKARRPELMHLAEVYRYVQEKDPVENDVIVLGDFNFGSDDEGWTYMKDFDSMKYLIDPKLKTTISDQSSYDNFWFQSRFTKEYAGTYGILKFDETMFHNNDRQAKLAVSDHRPIWAVFNTNDGDDD